MSIGIGPTLYDVHGWLRKVAVRFPLVAATALLPFAAALPASGDERRVIEVSLVDGVASGAAFTDLSGSVPTLVVDRGDSVELRWTSDRAMALHLHGYDLEAEVGPGMEATISFDARAAGRFPVETHDASGQHRAIIYLEVHPR